MITKNSSGGNLSANYGTVVAEDTRKWHAMLLVDGTELQCDIKSIEITKGSVGTLESFSIGSAVGNTLKAEVFNLSTPIKGRTLEYRVGLLTAEDTWEYITLGKFTVSEVKTTHYSSNIVAYGFLATKTGVAFSPPTTQSLANIASTIYSQTGLTVVYDSTIPTSKVISKRLTGMNVYQVLQIVAACCGGYVTDTYDGKIAIHTYRNSTSLPVGTGRMTTLPSIEEAPFEVTGAVVKVSGETSEDRYIESKTSIQCVARDSINAYSPTWAVPQMLTGTSFNIGGEYLIAPDTEREVDEEISEVFYYGTPRTVALRSDSITYVAAQFYNANLRVRGNNVDILTETKALRIPSYIPQGAVFEVHGTWDAGDIFRAVHETFVIGTKKSVTIASKKSGIETAYIIKLVYDGDRHLELSISVYKTDLQVECNIYEGSSTITGTYALSLVYDGANSLRLRLDDSVYPDFVYAELTDMAYTDRTLAVQYPANPTGTETLILDNPYMTADLYNNVLVPNLTSYGSPAHGYKYYPANILLSLGDPRLEGNDILAVTDIDGNIYDVPCHKVTHKFDGGLLSQITASKPTAEGDSISTSTPLSTRVDQLALSLANTNDAANRAIEYAQSAQQSADVASEQAGKATEYAAVAYEASQDATNSAIEAKVQSEYAEGYAGEAKTQADAAAEQAQEAQLSASRANIYANSALDQLGVVEDVVGVLELLQKNGDYEVTQDTTVVPSKWYFTRSGTAPNYIYTVVTNPTSIQYELTTDTAIDPNKTYYTRSGSGTEEDPYVYEKVYEPDVSDIGSYYECIYYELVGIDEAIQNYVSSQLVVTDEGLWLKRPDSTNIQTKILLSSTDGVVLYGANGQIIGKYGETAQIGDASGFHIEISGTELGFYQAGNKVAYLSNNQLYINQSVVVQAMDVGVSATDGGLGQWRWQVHRNADGQNNLNLKWIG